MPQHELLACAQCGCFAFSCFEDFAIRVNVSDWHAQLDPLFVFPASLFGGAAVLSAYWQMDRAANPNTLTLTAGDAFGASPPLSNFFEEEPAVLAMNLMGFDADTFGNHNFDRGVAHLQRMIDLAEFQYVSANLKNRDDNLTLVKDFEIFDVGGVKVAVIGITNSDAAELVFPGRFGTIEVHDLKATIKRARRVRKEADRAGAQVFILIAHQGVTGFDDDGNAVGPLIDIAKKVSGYHLILGDHTGVEFCGTFRGGKTLVVENRSRGRTYAKVKLIAESRGPLTKGKFKVIGGSCEFVEPVSSAVTPRRLLPFWNPSGRNWMFYLAT